MLHLIVILVIFAIFFVPARIIRVEDEKAISFQQERLPQMTREQIYHARVFYKKTIYARHLLLRILRIISRIFLIITATLFVGALSIQFGLLFNLVPVGMTRLWALSQSDGSRNLLLILASIVGSFGVMTWWYQYSRLLALIEDDSHRPEDLLWTSPTILQRQKECYLFMLVMFLMVVYGFTFLAVTNGIPSSVTPYYLPKIFF
ncbi:MAG: hypothetical protein ABF639_12085 [Lacticaseibacillus paracasei]